MVSPAAVSRVCMLRSAPVLTAIMWPCSQSTARVRRMDVPVVVTSRAHGTRGVPRRVHIPTHTSVPPVSYSARDKPSGALPVSVIVSGWPAAVKAPYTMMFAAEMEAGPTTVSAPTTYNVPVTTRLPLSRNSLSAATTRSPFGDAAIVESDARMAAMGTAGGPTHPERAHIAGVARSVREYPSPMPRNKMCTCAATTSW